MCVPGVKGGSPRVQKVAGDEAKVGSPQIGADHKNAGWWANDAW